MTVIAGTAGVAALGLIVVSVERAPGAADAARSASATTPMKVGGWGRGGYPMVNTAGGGPSGNGTGSAG